MLRITKIKIFWVYLIIVAIAISLCGCGTGSSPDSYDNSTISKEKTSKGNVSVGKNDIEIADYAFVPNVLTINKGEKVTWTNTDSAPHTIFGNGMESPSLATGQSFSYTFNDTGIFTYKCSIHPSMEGQIIVK